MFVVIDDVTVAEEEVIGDAAVEEVIGDAAVEEVVGDAAVEEEIGDVADDTGDAAAVVWLLCGSQLGHGIFGKCIMGRGERWMVG